MIDDDITQDERFNPPSYLDNRVLELIVVIALVTAIIIGVVAMVCSRGTSKDPQCTLDQKALTAIENEAEKEGERYAEMDLKQAEMDSIEEANRPTYTEYELEELVRSVVPSYSRIELWKKDNHDCIMKYERIKHNKTAIFLRTFDPTNKTFGREIEVTSTSSERNYSSIKVYTPKKGSGWYESNYYGSLIYFDKDGKAVKQWKNDRITSRLEATSTPPRFKVNDKDFDDYDDGLDGYEDAEDYFYDNAEDLYFYYNGDH